MNATQMRDALAAPQNGFPLDALLWARANPAEADPVLLAGLFACAKPADPTEREANLAFFAIHMLAERRDARAFAPLCALARNEDQLDFILGDALTEHLDRIVLGICGGDIAAVAAIVADEKCDQIVRAAFLDAWRSLVLSGAVSEVQARACLAQWAESFGKRDAGLLWYAWACAYIAIAPEEGLREARRALEAEWIDPAIAELRHFEQDASNYQADTDDMRATWLAEHAPFQDVIGYLDRWANSASPESEDHGYADEKEEEQIVEPAVNPFRDVGRNDPCPCGSGKKFKKCCLPVE